jgi:hypothetical protein
MLLNEKEREKRSTDLGMKTTPPAEAKIHRAKWYNLETEILSKLCNTGVM